MKLLLNILVFALFLVSTILFTGMTLDFIWYPDYHSMFELFIWFLLGLSSIGYGSAVWFSYKCGVS